MNENEIPKHTPTPGLYGWITHTELGSNDPMATKQWCSKVLDWHFMPEFTTPAGEYHLFSYSDKGGGGIRGVSENEVPGSIPFVHVANTNEAFELAISEGAESIAQPETLMPGVRTAIVKAPGGVLLDFQVQVRLSKGYLCAFA